MGNETGNEAVYRRDVQLADSSTLLVDDFAHFDIGFNYWMRPVWYLKILIHVTLKKLEYRDSRMALVIRIQMWNR